jgi:EpsI family protein
MSKRETRILAVALIFALQGWLVFRLAGSEQLPPLPDLQRFPSDLGDWGKTGEDHLDPVAIAQLEADRLLSWNYINRQSGVRSNWFVAWFQTQRNGAQPHSPKVCLPGNGWIPELSDQVSIPTAGGSFTANRYVVSQNGVRAVVIYWFETPRRTISSEWAAKFWGVADAIRDHRTDTALARVVVYEANQSDAVATAAAVQLAESAYPALHRVLRNPPTIP